MTETTTVQWIQNPTNPKQRVLGDTHTVFSTWQEQQGKDLHYWGWGRDRPEGGDYNIKGPLMSDWLTVTQGNQRLGSG